MFNLENLLGRRTFIGKLTTRVVAFVGVVAMPSKLLADCNCGNASYCPGCCLCNNPDPECANSCDEMSGCIWNWGNSCTECVSPDWDCQGSFLCEYCQYTMCSQCG